MRRRTRREYDFFRPQTKAGKKGKVWYFWYYINPDSNKRLNKSTGCEYKLDAEVYAGKWYEENVLKLKPEIPDSPTLQEFADRFYVWGECEYIKRKLVDKRRYSRYWAGLQRGYLDNHIFPAFGARTLARLEESESEIYDWLVRLPVKNQARNHIMSAFRFVFDEAIFRKKMKHNPLRNIIKAFPKDSEKPDVFTFDEIKKLFPKNEKKLIEIWSCRFWATFFFTMLTSGTRSQEPRALRWLHLAGEIHALRIYDAVKAGGEIGNPKNEEKAAVFIPERTLEMLHAWREAEECLYKGEDDLIFFGVNGQTPLSRKTVYGAFRRGLKAAFGKKKEKGETEDLFPGRHIVPHSLRHTYDTIMTGVLSAKMLQDQMRHRDERMTQEHYNHSDPVKKIEKYLPERDKIDEKWK